MQQLFLKYRINRALTILPLIVFLEIYLLLIPIRAAAVEKSIDTSLTVAARKWTGVRMKNLQEGTSLNVRLTIDGPAEVFLLNSSQIARFPLLQDTPLFHSELLDKLEFSLNIPASDHYVLVIDNRKGEVKRSFVLNLKASLERPAGPAIKPAQIKNSEQINQQLNKLTDSLNKVFIYDAIHIQLSECGKANAYSDSSTVYLCTEYLQQLLLRTKNSEQTQKIILFTLLHEIAHVLLKKWDYPLTENEEAVDEFATVVLIMFNQQSAAQTQAEFFAAIPAEQEFSHRSGKSDRHPLSAQRGQNIKRWLQSPNLVKQWQPLLIPHMQTSFLKQLAIKNLPWVNRSMVMKELSNRS
jgi:hypothetical protein